MTNTRRTTRRFDLHELVTISLVAALAGAVLVPKGAASQPDPEMVWLAEQYGPDKVSQYAEEWILRDFFGAKRNGVFVDIGAADPRVLSNTWWLESHLEWSGLAVDAQDEFRAGYEEHRPRTRFRSFFVSDRSDDRARLFLTDTPWVASSTKQFTARWGDTSQSREVPTVTLNDLLEAEGIESFDFLNMDIELAEPQALAGLDLGRYRPTLACVEAHPEVRQVIIDYFARFEYVVVGKYLRVDDRNLWFMPLGTSVPPFPEDVTRKWTH